MTHGHDMPRLWLTEEWAEECRPGELRTHDIHHAWRLYWKFCARHERAPLPVKRWAAACATLTNGAVAVVELGDGGGIVLASDPRETVHEALRAEKKNYRIRRRVAK